MTYSRLKSAVKLLLIGDNDIPEDNEQMLAAMEMAYIELSSKASSLRLLSADHASDIIRLGPNGTYLRMPNLPEDDSDELDIDPELAPALARILASYLSRNNQILHQSEANKVLVSYESKVRVFMERMEAEGAYDTEQAITAVEGPYA